MSTPRKRSDAEAVVAILKLLRAMDGRPHTRASAARLLGCQPRQAGRLLTALVAAKLVAPVPGSYKPGPGGSPGQFVATKAH